MSQLFPVRALRGVAAALFTPAFIACAMDPQEPGDPSDGVPVEQVAKDFLRALDEERWNDAARWLHPETLETVRRQGVELVRIEEGWPEPPPGPLDTYFTGPAEMLGVTGIADAEALSALEMAARFLAVLGPSSDRAEEIRLRLRRDLMDVEVTGSAVIARYRMEVFGDGDPLRHDPSWGEVGELRLVVTPDGWRIGDMSLSLRSGGNLILTDEEIELIRGEG